MVRTTRRTSLALGALCGLLWLGCASPAPGEIESELTAVSPDALEGQIFYLDPSFSTVPLTADQLEDFSDAEPVELRRHGDYLVAWWAPNGFGMVGNPDAVLFAWRVFDTAVPISDDVTDDDGAPEHVRRPRPELGVTGALAREVTVEEEQDGFRLPTLPVVYVDWLEEYTQEWRLWWGAHPGCI